MQIKHTAFLFDLNGTMVDDMPYHISAWHEILNQLGAGLTIEQVKNECYGKNHELLERIFPGRFTQAEKNKMSWEKEEAYQLAFKPFLKLIDGLPTFLEDAKKAGIPMAIGSAAIMFNIDFVLNNLHLQHFFDAIISADDVELSKPNPETYFKCAAKLGAVPSTCLVFEDAPKGVESAANAGMNALVIQEHHSIDEFSAYNNIITFTKDYTTVPVSSLI